MKKLLVLMLAAALALSLVACGGGGDNPNNNNTTPDTQGTQDIQQDDIQQDDVQQEPEPIIYNFGDSVTSPSGMFVFTPTFDGFAAAVGNWPDENYLRPNGKGVDESNNPYVADEGKVMMYYSGVVEYIGDSKETETFDFEVKVDYDNGYVFKDGGKGYSSNESDWTYSATSFEPLSSYTSRYVRFCIEVPDTLEKDFEKQTVTIFTIEGEEFTYLVDTKAAADARVEREAAEEAERQERMAPVDDILASEIKEQIQGTFSWSVPGFANEIVYTTSHELTFDGDTVYIQSKNSLIDTTLSNTGTYYISNAYFVLDFQDGSQALMPYTYENGEVSMSSEFEGAFYTA